MDLLFSYILKSAAVLTLLYVPYMLLLRKESFFRFNRMVLLFILAASFLLPLFNLPLLHLDFHPFELNPHVEVGSLKAVDAETASDNPSVSPGSSANVGVIQMIAWAYICGVIVVFLLKVVRLCVLWRRIHQGVLWTERRSGATIFCHADDIPSFSWFRMVVISETDYRQHGDVIIRHELGHVAHHHSIDLLIVNLMQTLQWANPFAWLLGTSMIYIHEYEADDTVLRSGVKAREYMSLLMRKAVGSCSYAFANGFNHSLLKKRFTMMLREKSNPWMRAKALYVIPVAMIALSVFASPLVSGEKPEQQKPATPSGNSLIAGIPAHEALNDTVLDICEVLPQYPGGEAALMNLLVTQVRYPKIAIENNVQGTIIVGFVVEKDGKCTNFEVRKAEFNQKDKTAIETAASPEVTVVAYGSENASPAAVEEAQKAIKDEALRVCRLLKPFKPGMQKGEAVRVKFSIPVMFRLN